MTVTEEQQVLIDQMKIKKKLLAEIWSEEPSFVYYGMDHFLLEHGQWYEPTPWNNRYPFGVPKMCFGNSLYHATTRRRWRYVEGFVVVEGLEFLPIHHAWNLDASGKLIDTTLRNNGTLYLGVEFSVGRASEAIHREMTILDDYMRGHPLLRQRWQGEDFSKVWKRRSATRPTRP